MKQNIPAIIILKIKYNIYHNRIHPLKLNSQIILVNIIYHLLLLLLIPYHYQYSKNHED
jgi:hypothetical protein